MKARILFALLIIAIIPFALAPPGDGGEGDPGFGEDALGGSGDDSEDFASYCLIEGTNCYRGLTELICTAEYEGTYAPYDTADTGDGSVVEACEIGCCVINGLGYQNTKEACTASEGTFNSGACEEDVPVVCGEGQTNCVCGVEPITDGQYCCGGQVSDVECSSGGGDPTDQQSEELCGNGNWDYALGEICESTLSGEEYGNCPTGDAPQTCTQNCRCGWYVEDDIDPDICTGIGDCETETCITDDFALEVTANTAAGEPAIDVSWGTSSTTCEDEPTETTVSWVDQAGGASGTATPTSGTARIEDLEWNHYYTVTVAVTIDGVSRQDTVRDIWVKPERCALGKESWCTSGTEWASCEDKDGKAAYTEGDCGGQYCFDTLTGHVCQDFEGCETCNGAYDEFGEALSGPGVAFDRTVEFNGKDYACDEGMIDTPELEGLMLCYLDAQDSASYIYTSCAETSTCADYRTENACINDEQRCNVLGSCAWDADINYCYTEEDELEPCGADNQETCEAIPGGMCLWDINTDSCERKDELGCGLYTSQDTCTGGTDWSMNQATHAPQAESQNDLGITKCKWTATRGCFRDANDDDSPENKFDPDFTNPVTTLVRDLSVEQPASITIPYYLSEAVEKTRYELKDGACADVTERPTNRPNEETREIVLENLEQGATYCIHYYSMDPSKNMEEVKQEEFTISTEQEYSLEITSVEHTITLWPDQETADLDIIFTLSTQARCDATLGDLEWPKIDGLYDDQFGMFANDLSGGTYQLDISCATPYAEDSYEEAITIDLDARITEPVPSQRTYAPGSLFGMGVHAQEASGCEYYDGSWQDLPDTSTTTIEGESYTRYTTPTTPQSTGYYSYAVRCDFAAGTLLGDEEDRISFAIDATPPRTTITYEEEGETVTITENPANLAVGEGGLDLSVTCEDVGIPGGGEQWESDEVTLYLEADGETQEVTTESIRVQEDETIQIHCEDEYGNVETPWRIQGSEEDITGPERPAFEVTS